MVDSAKVDRRDSLIVVGSPAMEFHGDGGQMHICHTTIRAEIVLQRSVKVSRSVFAVNEEGLWSQEDRFTVYTSVICIPGSKDYDFFPQAF